jgi:hypothetical protein
MGGMPPRVILLTQAGGTRCQAPRGAARGKANETTKSERKGNAMTDSTKKTKSKYAKKMARKNGRGRVDPRWMWWTESEVPRKQ